ncbi:MAG: hypothetical protein AB8F95_12925 [Bacteroidia bacterium]
MNRLLPFCISLLGLVIWASPLTSLGEREGPGVETVVEADMTADARTCRCKVERKLFDEFIDNKDTLMITSVIITRRCPNRADCKEKKCKIKFRAVDPDDSNQVGWYEEEAECVGGADPIPVDLSSGTVVGSDDGVVVVEPTPSTRCNCPVTVSAGQYIVIDGDSLIVTKAKVTDFCTKKDCSDKCAVTYSASGEGHSIRDAVSRKDCEKP